MRNGLIIAIINIIACLINSAQAQQQIFKNYSLNDGLVSNTVRRVYQDAKGFLWIATLEGLSKYDGHRFSNYTTANGLSHNMVNDFYETKDGQLYVALNNGAIDLISGNKVFPKVAASDTVVNRFLHHSSGQVIASTDRNGLHQFYKDKLSRTEQLFAQQTFYELLWVNDSVFITVEEHSIKVFNRKYKLLSETSEKNLINFDSKIYRDSKNRIWVSTLAGVKLLTFLPDKNKPLIFTTPPPPFNFSLINQTSIRKIFEDADGTMWFATNGGVVKINADGSSKIITIKDGLASNLVTEIFQDKEKNLWFGTAAGLSKLVTRQSITLYPLEDAFLENNYSYLLHFFKKNHFLLGTLKSIKIFNKESEKFTAVENSYTENYYDVVLNGKQTTLISYNNMTTFDTATLKLTTSNPLPEKYASRVINAKKGCFFSRGVSQLIFKSGNFQQSILKYRISAIIIDKKGDLWAGTWQNGLFRIKYTCSNNRINIISTQQFLATENIRSLFEDSRGNIWAGTRYQGVYQIIKKEKDSFTIVNFDQKKGLTSNFIKGIREDANGNIWIAFYQGLDKIITTASSCRIFNFSRVNNYFTTIIGMETDDEHILWLGTNEGLVKITDGEMEKLPPLPVYITKVFSHDSVYATSTQKIHLNYRQNQLQFEFSSPGFINEKQLLYSYRLVGSTDTAWTMPVNQNTVSYASLNAGNYNFEVRTLGWNGNWGPLAQFEFIIHPPFWQTWWFIVIVSLFVVLGIYFFIKWRIKSVKTIAAEKLKVQKLHAESYRNKLELEQITNYFSNSLNEKKIVGDVLWDVAKNLIGRMGFVDCIIYLYNDDKTKMIQKAAFGLKGSVEEINKNPFDVWPGQGVVGYVMQTKETVLIPDTKKDSRYRQDEMERLSEITVPIIYNNELIGIIDSEHPQKDFYTAQHLQLLTTIATLVANKIKSIEAQQSLQQTQIEIYSINEQLSKAKLDALRSQMNPHFIFNCINSIDALIQSNDKYQATVYLNKFAKLLRNILDSSKQNTVTLSKDINTLKLYIELEQLRHENKFTAEVYIDDFLMQDDFKVPPLIIQPFVENAILHGIRYRTDNNGKLTVSVTKKNNYIQYIIEDNGVGRNFHENKTAPEKISYGIEMTNDRVKLFNNEEKAFIEIIDLIVDNKPTGTRVRLLLKLI